MSTAESRRADGPTVSLIASQDKYLPAGAGASEVQAVLTVRTSGLHPAPQSAAEVIVIDCSGSMGWPASKIEAARRATAAAVAVLRDGTRFAVIQGTESARTVYPATASLAVAGPDSRAEAIACVQRLNPGGGTAIGAWLTLARDLLAERPAEIRHVLLLTDGKNETEQPDSLRQVLAACRDSFNCDARGIGDGWDAKELNGIASRLHGTADLVLRDADLEAEFTAMMHASMARALADLRIRLTRLPGTAVRYLKQVFPTEWDLTADGRRIDERTTEYHTPAWADEARQYQVCLTADPAHRPRDEDLLLAFVELVTDRSRLPLPEPVPVLVHWIDGHRPSTVLNSVVDHFNRYRELGKAVAEAHEAYYAGDLPGAETSLDRVLRLAHLLHDRAMLTLLAGLLRSTGPDAGPARLKEDIDPRQIDRLLLLSSHTTLAPGDHEPEGARSDPPGAYRICPRTGCGAPAPPGAAYCPECGRPLGDA